MADYRTNKSIATRVNVEFNRRPNPLRRWRRLVTWACFLLSLAVAAVLIWREDKTVYWSGEVSTAHGLFQNDCRQCHDQAFQPVGRLLALNNSVRSVSVAACKHCHPKYSSHDHHQNMAEADRAHIDNCVVCHKEHRGQASLSWVSDAHCVRCHGNLAVKAGTTASHVPAISSFAEHPEFALLRGTSQNRPGPAHLAHKLAEFLNDRPATDRAQIKFNHQYHLQEKGLPVPPGHPEYGDGKTPVVLNCGDCHQPDETGQYMRPINYENHCSQCHRLQYSTRLALAGPNPSPLPHVQPKLIRGGLRDRLMAFAKANPAEVLDKTDPNADELGARHPNQRRPKPITAKDEWTWVEKMLAEIEIEVKDGSPAERPPTGKLMAQVKYGCAHCHTIEQSDLADPADTDWRIVPPRIPKRWLPHSRFDHSRHTQVSCRTCHDPLAATDPEAALAGQTLGGPFASEKTGDVLMPSIRICQSCHTSKPGLQLADKTAWQGQARDRCVECHTYHHQSGMTALFEGN